MSTDNTHPIPTPPSGFELAPCQLCGKRGECGPLSGGQGIGRDCAKRDRSPLVDADEFVTVKV